MTILPALTTIPATPAAVGTARTYGFGFIAYGLIVMLQDPRRWSGPSYATVTAVAEPWVWGVILASLGVFTLVGSYTYIFWLRNLGLYLGALWVWLLALFIIDVARHTPTVSFAGAVFYVFVGVAICWVATTREVPLHVGLPKI